MTLQEGVEIYGAAIATLTILAASVRYILSSKIKPLEKDLESLKRDNKDLEDEVERLKAGIVNDIKDISQGNFEFRLKNEGAIKDLYLILSEKYASKEQLEKEASDIKRKIEIHHDIKEILENILKKENKQ